MKPQKTILKKPKHRKKLVKIYDQIFTKENLEIKAQVHEILYIFTY